MENMLPPDADLIPHDEMRRISRTEYERLCAERFFGDERVELLFGMVVTMPPPDARHDTAIYHVHELLRRAIGERAMVRNQSSFAASDDSMPVPDIFVISTDDYWNKRPSRAQLVVEVSNTSIRRDRVIKARLYARVDVEEYWIVDVNDGTVEVHRDHRDGRWRSITTFGRGDTLSPLAFPDVVIAVSEIVPPID